MRCKRSNRRRSNSHWKKARKLLSETYQQQRTKKYIYCTIILCSSRYIMAWIIYNYYCFNFYFHLLLMLKQTHLCSSASHQRSSESSKNFFIINCVFFLVSLNIPFYILLHLSTRLFLCIFILLTPVTVNDANKWRKAENSRQQDAK